MNSEKNISPECQDNNEISKKIGAHVLTAATFEQRHKEIADSSLQKQRKRGEKYTGSNGEQRNLAYIERLEKVIEKYGNEAERELWEKTIDKNGLIIEKENIPDSYWETQEQILRDNGQGRKLSNYEKDLLVEEIQRTQYESIKEWTDYLGHEECPYPLWFKIYAFDGVSKMSVFDKSKMIFGKRNDTTVSPYPHLNASVLAKTYEAIMNHYNPEQNESGNKTSNEERDEKVKNLITSGSFNKIYSYLMLKTSPVIKTPEKTEDIHGEWVEYRVGNEEELAKAADGTPWCIASPTVGRHYLTEGEYGTDNYYDDDDYSESQAKFILFHLQDPDTGQLSKNACASIRLDLDGDVAEISGLNSGQALEDSLVPIVEKKVKTLPGGKEFLKAFADKKRLIALDKIMQNGETNFSEDDIDFIFEINREIYTLDTYNDTDPRVKELRYYIMHNLDKFLAAGADIDPTSLANKLIGGSRPGYVADNLDKFLAAGADIDPTSLANKLAGSSVANNLDKFLAAGADPTSLANWLIEEGDDDSVANNLDKFLAAGADPTSLANELIERGYDDSVANNLDKFLAAGADIDPTSLANGLIGRGRVNYVVRNLDKFLAAGADPTSLANGLIGRGRARSDYVARNLDKFLAAGADRNKINLP